MTLVIEGGGNRWFIYFRGSPSSVICAKCFKGRTSPLGGCGSKGRLERPRVDLVGF